MLWGPEYLQRFTEVRANYPVWMGPNEPNLSSQANMAVGDLVTFWNTYIRWPGQGKTLICPAITTAPEGKTYMQEFFKQCGGNDNCGCECLNLHPYYKNPADLIAYVTDMHNTFNMPICITEFACQNFYGDESDATMGEVWAFMTEVLKFFETTSWVILYAPFGFEYPLSIGPNNALMDANGNPTPLGRYFLDTTF